ncbi:MAG: ABC transporter permease [Flexilinea sp.]|jgi:ribose transport system permease protein
MKTEEKKKNIFSRIFAHRESSVFLIIIVSAAITGIIQPRFFSVSNLRSIAVGLSTDGILAIALTLVLILGGIELSVGSVMALSCVIVGGLFLADVNIWICILVALAAGVGVGYFNGFMISKVGLPPFIVTLAMMSLARGVAYIFTEGSPLSMGGLPEWFRFLGKGSIGNIPMLFIIFIGFAIIFDILLRTSNVFRNIFYVGSNEAAANLSGINVAKVKIWVYIISAVLSTIAGILSLARFNVATPTLGTMAETKAISAAIIGGTSFSGGVGSILGTVFGVILLNLINNALIMLNVSVYWQDFVTGAILILAVTFDYVSHQKKK